MCSKSGCTCSMLGCTASLYLNNIRSTLIHGLECFRVHNLKIPLKGVGVIR